MSAIYPFAALRPVPKAAAVVAAVPYDVVNTEEARALAAGNSLSFLHVSRPEIDLAAGANPYSEAVYELAKKNFTGLKRDAPLVVEETPSFYLYRLHMGTHTQTGMAACYSIDEYDRGLIKKHEKTRPDKEDDRGVAGAGRGEPGDRRCVREDRQPLHCRRPSSRRFRGPHQPVARRQGQW
jgi:uncharacterized protein (DUF1015 family)